MVFGKKLSRGRKSREALFRSLCKGLISNGKVLTTKAKAKAIIKDADRLVTLGKDGTISAKRKVSAILGNERKLTEIVFKKIVPAFSSKQGGYTRIIALPSREGDNAEMARIEWSEKIIFEEPKKEKKESMVKSVKKETKTKRKKQTVKKEKK